MSPVLRYHTGSGVYADLPGNIEEVTISPNQPPVNTDLWIDTDDDTGYIPSSRLGSRNVIRNGDMSISQRGDGPWTGPAGYTVDNVWTYNVGGTVTTSRVAPTAGDIGYWYRAVVVGGTAAGAYTHATVQVEDVSTLNGKTVTVSFTAKAASGAPKLGLRLAQVFGSGGSAAVPTPGQAVTLSTTATRYSLVFSLPSVSGKTIGAGNYLSLEVWFSSGSTNNAAVGGIGVQNGTFSITDIQLEEGSVATPFERLPQQQQLAWCQRYFVRLGSDNPHIPTNDPGGAWFFFGTGFVLSSTEADVMVSFPQVMRTVPTVVPSSTITNFAVSHGGVGAGGTSRLASMVPYPYSSTGTEIYMVTSPPAMSQSGAAIFDQYMETSAYLDISAEL